MYALASLRRPSGVPWSLPLLRGRRGTMCTAKGSDVRPGVPPASLRCPLVSAAFAWQAWDNVHRQGVGCTPWRPSGVPPVSLGLRRFCVAGVGQCALPRGRMYALASLRRPSGVPWSPPLLRGRRGTMCTAKGSDVRPGVPPAFLRCPLVSAAFAWQAWDNVHCQGVGCTPWRPSGVPPVSLGLRRFCVAGVGQCAPPRGRMYALASLRRPSGVPPVSLGLRRFCVAGVGQCAPPRGRMYALASLRRPSGVPWSPPLLRGRRGTMCTAKGSDARPGVPPASLRCPLVSAAFAWQAWDNVHCQGVGCTPWRPSGVPPVSLGLRRFCVAGVGQCAPPRGRMYALASLRRPSGVPWSPPLLRGRRGTMCTAKGSDVRPGVPPASLRCPLVSAAFAWQAWDNVHRQGVGCTPWRPSGVPPVSLGLRRFCVAGVGQCAPPRGRMYALASLRRPSGVPWSPPLLRGRRRTISHSLTLTLTLTLTHSLTLTLTLTHSLTLTHTHSLTHSHNVHSLTVHEHTYIHTNSPTITAPSLLYFLFPSCFSMVSLSLKKLVTCGVIRSFNLLLVRLDHHSQLVGKS